MVRLCHLWLDARSIIAGKRLALAKPSSCANSAVKSSFQLLKLSSPYFAKSGAARELTAVDVWIVGDNIMFCMATGRITW